MDPVNILHQVGATGGGEEHVLGTPRRVPAVISGVFTLGQMLLIQIHYLV
jgi:hypothetical protein